MDRRDRDKDRRHHKRLVKLGSNNPSCACGEKRVACLGKPRDSDLPYRQRPITCSKCINKHGGKTKQAKKSKKTCVGYHACTDCDDADCFLYDHHLYDFDGLEIIIPECDNCHDVWTAEQTDFPIATRKARNDLEAIGVFLLNLNILFQHIAKPLKAFPNIVDLLQTLGKYCEQFGLKLIAIGQQMPAGQVFL